MARSKHKQSRVASTRPHTTKKRPGAGRKSSGRKSSGVGRSSVASRIPTATDDEFENAARRFERGVLSRGEAVPESDGESLPPGATHELTKGDRPRLERRRFSAR